MIRVAVGLIGLQLIVRGWTCVRGWFYLDDFAFMARATEFRLFDPDYLLHTYNNHVMPGAWVWVWVTTRLFPLQWLPVVVVILLLQLLLSILVLRLLVSLFGLTPLILPPLAIASLAPISLPGSLWWAAALNQLPQQLAIVVGLLALVRYLRSGSRTAALAGPLALAGGLLFSEKTILLVPLTVAIAVAFFTSGGLLQRLGRTMRRDRLMWCGFGVVALPYLAGYVLVVPSPLRNADIPGHDIVELVMSFVFRATIPGLLGGPLRWQPIGFAGALSAPNGFVVAVSLLAMAAVVAATIAIHRHAVWAWLILTAYVVVNIAILSRSRAVLVGPIAATELRYQTDVALVGALMLAFASTAVSGSFRRGEPTRLSTRKNVVAAIESRLLTPWRELGPVSEAAVTAVVSFTGVAVIAALAVVSTHAYDPFWVGNPAKAWTQTVRSELAGLPAGTRLADSMVPQQVAWGLLFPYNESYRTLSPILADDEVLTPGASAAHVVVPDQQGHLRAALPSGGKAASGPVRDCGWRVTASWVTVPVPRTLPNPTTLIRVGVGSTAPTTLIVRAAGHDSEIELSAGLSTAFLQTRDAVSELQLRVQGRPARVCTDDISVGPAVAIPGTAP